jgi:hypothetical protein
MLIPVWIVIFVGLVFLAMATWLYLIVKGRNPLPFPDHGSRIFSAPSADAKTAIVDLLAQHGLHERFQVNTPGVLRSIMWDGTIINCPEPAMAALIGSPSASIGLVSADPVASSAAAASFLISRGFEARVVTDAEPDLPVVFVVTNAFSGSVLNFRKHVIHMPRP